MQLYESLFIVAAAVGERDLRLCEMLQVSEHTVAVLYTSTRCASVLQIV